MSKDNVGDEAEYFHEREREALEALKAKRAAEAAEAAKEALKALHHLHCGKCGNKMNTEIYKGVEIEVCPACGAVLLDPGELQELAGADTGGAMAWLGALFTKQSDD